MLSCYTLNLDISCSISTETRDKFDSDRVQVIGNVEYAYLQKMEDDHGTGIMKKLLSFKMPCIVFCRGIEIKEDIRKIATEVSQLHHH